ncbi:MAG: hypothetical protein IKP10_07575 [Clostridia bacterium]|nr:hypothetical protein [Clostridia bacterium]
MYSSYPTYETSAQVLGWTLVPLLITLLAVAVPCIVAWCILFRKAGVPAGFFFIPVYGTYKTYDVAGCTGIFWGTLATGIGGAVMAFICAMLNSVVGVLIVYGLMLVTELILQIFFCRSLAASFAKGGGFAAGLFFLFPVFLMILAFGRAEHNYGRARRIATSSEVWTCKECGTVNGAGSAHCVSCGRSKVLN